MRRIVFLLFIVCLHLSATGQVIQKEPTITLIGQANKSVMPDKAVFNLRVSSLRKTETESFEAMTAVSNEVTKRLKAEGFTEKDIKLTDYSVQMQYDYSDEKPKLAGYISSQSFIVKFPLDKKRMMKVYSALASDDMKELSVNFFTECSDSLKKKIQQELITAALKDARENAELIAKSSGNTVKGISDINYKAYGPDVRPYDNMARAGMMMEKGAPSTEFFTINEQQFVEEVKVVYTIN